MKYIDLLWKVILAIFTGFVLAIVSPIIIFIVLLNVFHRIYVKIFVSNNMQIIDPIFGKILFIPDNEKPYWVTGEGFFSPTNSQVTFLVNASKSGPTKKQKEFYQDIETNYQTYFETIWFPFLLSAIDTTWFQEKENSKYEWRNSFSVNSITIPRFTGKKYEWNVTFITTSDEHYFTIEMKGWIPDSLQIDG